MLAALDAALAPRFVRGHDVKAAGYLPTVQSAPELQSGYHEMNLVTELPSAPDGCGNTRPRNTSRWFELERGVEYIFERALQQQRRTVCI